jgi:hypothetical protein
MVHGLAAQSGGKLVLHSVPGEGTTAELWLPRADATAVSPTPRHLDATEPRLCTMLVADDDPWYLESTAAMLEDLGHIAI